MGLGEGRGLVMGGIGDVKLLCLCIWPWPMLGPGEVTLKLFGLGDMWGDGWPCDMWMGLWLALELTLAWGDIILT